MKTIFQKLRFNILLLIFIFTLGSFISQAQDRKESFDKSFSLSASGNFDFSCYDTDLKVNTWNKDEVKLVGEIIIKGGDKEDQDKLIEVFKNPEITQSSNSLKIVTNMVSNTIIIGPISTITLINGSKIKIDKYSAKYTLWVPESIAFTLKSKYNDIEIAPLKGKINFDLYDADLTMAGYGSNAIFTMKYSNASIGNGGDAMFNIYDSDIEVVEMKNAKITSKYSGIVIGAVNTLDFDSYDDDIKIEKINSLNSTAKYSDYKIKGDLTNCIIDLYDSDIEAANISQLIFSGKYSEIKAGNVNQFHIKDIYDSDVKMAEVGEFSCDESKYDYFAFSSIKSSVKMPNVYDSDLVIGKADPSLKLFEGNFKYCSISMPLDPALSFSLEFETTYGEVKYPKERFTKNITSIKENSKHQFSGSTGENAVCKIKFTAYDSNVSF
ncbi:MAG: hypothetical protein AB7S50_00210 [Bacteroidales bacterium]